ncbi:MAG: tRNA (N6-threonylcarbamoyladenosine(37)-N6)-methyltransferase TrmO [Oscillospiraceae bacterium]
MELVLRPVGFVRSGVTEKRDSGWGGVDAEIVLEAAFTGGLKGLEAFSHAIVVYYLHEAAFCAERHLVRRPRGRADMPLLGVFAQRVKDRPNPVGITAVEITGVSADRLAVRGLDAIDGTPVLDIKPYFPAYDCRGNAVVPDWVHRLMEDYF